MLPPIGIAIAFSSQVIWRSMFLYISYWMTSGDGHMLDWTTLAIIYIVFSTKSY